MFSKQNRDKLQKIIKKYNFCQKSPYSDSFYTEGEITWNSKPEGSLRLSDHWNFESEGQTHCKLDSTSEYLQNWLVCEYHNGKYHIIEEVFTPEEEALELRMYEKKHKLVNEYVKLRKDGKEGTKEFKKLVARMQKQCAYYVEL